MPIYLDCNATTPIEPAVAETLMKYLTEEYGNAGSRTHEFGARAHAAVQIARERVAALVDAQPDEVTFTSGATEANNLAILGLAGHNDNRERRHVIATAIEHKAVLEPLERLRSQGFEVELARPSGDGVVEPLEIARRLRKDTLLVSVMHVNNETGVIQPIADIATTMADHPAFLHVDGAQGFGKDDQLRCRRIDLLTISGHKVFAPKGIGALVGRRRGYRRPPLQPLMVGGGQERGLRPGTLAVAQIAALGLAADLCSRQSGARNVRNCELRRAALAEFAQLGARFYGDPSRTVPHTLSMSFPGLDSEAVMLAWKGIAAISNGSACTSHEYSLSHVLLAMGLAPDEVRRVVRISWCHLTPDVPWQDLVELLRRIA